MLSDIFRKLIKSVLVELRTRLIFVRLDKRYPYCGNAIFAIIIFNRFTIRSCDFIYRIIKEQAIQASVHFAFFSHYIFLSHYNIQCSMWNIIFLYSLPLFSFLF